MRGPASVRMLDVKTVVPAEPTQPHHLFLTCFDIHMWHLPYMKRILFYPPGGGGGEGFFELVAGLSGSLAEALVLFYPYAGRMVEREEGQRPSLECNDAGVQFVTAEATVALEDLGPGLDPDPDVFSDLLHTAGDRAMQGSDFPLLCVQVTRFLCGGIALGLAYSQVVSDATAFWNFVRAWSEICRKQGLSSLPKHRRYLLKVTDLSTEIDSAEFHPTLYTFADPWKANMRRNGKPGKVRDYPPSSPLLLQERQVHRMFVFPADTIQKLKNLAKSSKSGSEAAANKLKRPECEALKKAPATRGQFTSLEVLGAHLWRCTTRARNPPGHSETKFVIESDCRRRLPFLPDSYFGNAVCCTAAVTTVKELVESPLYFSAKLIHKARRKSVSEQYIRVLVHYSEQHGNLRPVDLDPTRQCLTTAIQNSSKHPIYDCDFGWGSPFRVRSGNMDEQGAYAIFPANPKLPKGSVEVAVVLPAGAMARLEQDHSFLLQL